MNEEGNGTSAPQAQNPALAQPQASAVNAGFDVNKVGQPATMVSQDAEKTKKDSKPKKTANRKRVPGSNAKHPAWFWIVLGILGLVIVGVTIWAIVMLVGGNDAGSGQDLDDGASQPTELTLVEGDNVVDEYLKQLRSIAGKGEDGWDEATEGGMDKARDAAGSAIAKTSSEKQENSVRAAEIALLYQDDQYDEVIELYPQVNPELLSIEERWAFYHAIYRAYYLAGDNAKADEYSQLVINTTTKLCEKDKSICES